MAGEKCKARRAAYFAEVAGEHGTPLVVYDKSDIPKEDKEATRRTLAEESERLSALVAKQGSSTSLTKACSGLLADTRALLTKNAAQLDSGAVVNRLEEVKQRLLRAYDSREAWWVCILVAAWNVGLLVLIGLVVFWWKDLGLVPGRVDLEQTWRVFQACVLWGCVGGIVDALLAIQAHFGKQDFDSRYWPWYLLHPILACSLGAVIFLLLQAGLLTLGFTSLKESDAGTAAFPLALAFLVGFKQNTVSDFLTRVVKSIFQSSQSTDTA